MHRLWLQAVGVAVVAPLSVAGLPDDAHACSYAGPSAYHIEPDPADQTPPSEVELSASVSRGQGTRSDGCGTVTGTSCDDVGGIELHVLQADDEPDQLGFRLWLVAGNLPEGLSLPIQQTVAGVAGNEQPWDGGGPRPRPPTVQESTLHLGWVDGATDDQEPIDFTLEVTPVDRAGNEGPPSTIRITDPGGSAGGCSVAKGTGSATLAAFALLTSAGMLRRRRRP